MSDYEKAMRVLEALFAKDCVFALATAADNVPSVRMVDTYCQDGKFYVVTYANSRKGKELIANPRVALCYEGYRFEGEARNLGHPLQPENAEIRETLTRVFAPWYFAHNNEADEAMCFVRIDPRQGFFHQDGTGYQVDFAKREAKAFPFAFDVQLPD